MCGAPKAVNSSKLNFSVMMTASFLQSLKPAGGSAQHLDGDIPDQPFRLRAV